MIDLSSTFSQAMCKKKSRLRNNCIKIKIRVLWIKKIEYRLGWRNFCAASSSFKELVEWIIRWPFQGAHCILTEKLEKTVALYTGSDFWNINMICVVLQFARFARVVRHSRCRGIAGGLRPLATYHGVCETSLYSGCGRKVEGLNCWHDPWRTILLVKDWYVVNVGCLARKLLVSVMPLGRRTGDTRGAWMCNKQVERTGHSWSSVFWNFGTSSWCCSWFWLQQGPRRRTDKTAKLTCRNNIFPQNWKDLDTSFYQTSFYIWISNIVSTKLLAQK